MSDYAYDDNYEESYDDPFDPGQYEAPVLTSHEEVARLIAAAEGINSDAHMEAIAEYMRHDPVGGYEYAERTKAIIAEQVIRQGARQEADALEQRAQAASQTAQQDARVAAGAVAKLVEERPDAIGRLGRSVAYAMDVSVEENNPEKVARVLEMADNGVIEEDRARAVASKHDEIKRGFVVEAGLMGALPNAIKHGAGWVQEENGRVRPPVNEEMLARPTDHERFVDVSRVTKGPRTPSPLKFGPREENSIPAGHLADVRAYNEHQRALRDANAQGAKRALEAQEARLQARPRST